MYAVRPNRAKPPRATPGKLDAPTAGWVANRNLSDPRSIEGTGAFILDNFFPTSSKIVLRRGKQLYATLGDGTLDPTAIFTFKDGTNRHLFAATETTIYDITSVISPTGGQIVADDADLIVTDTGDWFGWSSTGGLEIASGYTGGNWVTTQHSTSGNVYLIGVNGKDEGFIYDGDFFWPYVAGGISSLGYDMQTGDFVPGEIVTGGTSGATATVVRQDSPAPGSGTLRLRGVTGTFQDNETLTGSIAGAALSDGLATLTIPGMTFPGLTTADMSYVWVYKERLWFAQNNSMNAWYATDIDSVGGTADVLPLGGVFNQGGSLMFGSAWSMEGSLQGGLSEQNVYVSDQGEVAVYQGSDPAEAATWSKVGVYRIGSPLGNLAHIQGGGDIAVATSVGLVPLSKAISLDVTSLNVATISYKIADAWSDAILNRGQEGWHCKIWPEQKMAVVAPPDLIGSTFPVLFISNTETGAWSRYTGWQALCMDVFEGRLYFGSPGGKIYIANVGGLDDDQAYTGAVAPLYNDMGSPASWKVGKVGRAVWRANGPISDEICLLTDFDTVMCAPPNASGLASSNVWGVGIWGQATWGAISPSVITQNWESIGGCGYSLTIGAQVTSGAIAPLDAEMIRIDFTYETGTVMS